MCFPRATPECLQTPAAQDQNPSPRKERRISTEQGRLWTRGSHSTHHLLAASAENSGTPKSATEERIWHIKTRTNTSSSAGRLETADRLRVLPEASSQSVNRAARAALTQELESLRVTCVARPSAFFTEDVPTAGHKSVPVVFNSCVEFNVTSGPWLTSSVSYWRTLGRLL